MSNEQQQQIDVLLRRMETLLRAAWLIGTALCAITVWVARQEFTDNAQNEILRKHEAELAARGEWMKETSDRLSRMEERQEYIRNDTREIKDILRQRGNE